MSGFAVEDETGTFAGTARVHNGYWAGDFASSPDNDKYLVQWFEWGRSHAEAWNHRTNSDAPRNPRVA